MRGTLSSDLGGRTGKILRSQLFPFTVLASMSNILSQNWLLSRRRFLRGAGAAVALPLLNCMVPVRSMATETAATPKPRRSVFVYIPNGVQVLTWQINKAG